MDTSERPNLAVTDAFTAAAVHYPSGSVAPKLLAKGHGETAEAILARAIELGIPIKSEPTLVGFLLQLDLNQLVPPDLYAAMAEVLAWAYQNDRERSKSSSSDL